MARQTPVRSYNTVHNKIQNARTAFSSKFFVILAIVIAGTVVFFSGRFYLAEKNGTTNGDATVASSADVVSDGTTMVPSPNGSSGSISSQGGSSGSSTIGGPAADASITSGCETPSVPAAACTTMRNIESNGLVGNPLVTTSFPNIPDSAALIVDDTSWAQSSDSTATVKMSAFHNKIVDRLLLQLNLQGGNWVVTSFIQQ